MQPLLSLSLHLSLSLSLSLGRGKRPPIPHYSLLLGQCSVPLVAILLVRLLLGRRWGLATNKRSDGSERGGGIVGLLGLPMRYLSASTSTERYGVEFSLEAKGQTTPRHGPIAQLKVKERERERRPKKVQNTLETLDPATVPPELRPEQQNHKKNQKQAQKMLTP